MRDDWKEFLRTLRDAHARAIKRGQYSTVNHISLRVNDMDRAEKLISGVFGVGPIVRFPEEYGLMPGEKAIGCFWIGDVYFELIEQEVADEPIAGSGLPIGLLVELGFFVADIEKEIERLAAAGYVLLYRGGGDGVNFAHLDTDPPSGIPLEIIEVSPELDKVLTS